MLGITCSDSLRPGADKSPGGSGGSAAPAHPVRGQWLREQEGPEAGFIKQVGLWLGELNFLTSQFRKQRGRARQPIAEYCVGNQPKYSAGAGHLRVLCQMCCVECFVPSGNSFQESCHTQESFASVKNDKVLKKM